MPASIYLWATSIRIHIPRSWTTLFEVFRHLFSVFFIEKIVNKGAYDETTTTLVSKVGEALALPALESKQNYRRMINIKLQNRSKYESNLIVKLISVLVDENHGMHATRILRNLCAYTETDYVELSEVTVAAAKVQYGIQFITQFKTSIKINFHTIG